MSEQNKAKILTEEQLKQVTGGVEPGPYGPHPATNPYGPHSVPHSAPGAFGPHYVPGIYVSDFHYHSCHKHYPNNETIDEIIDEVLKDD